MQTRHMPLLLFLEMLILTGCVSIETDGPGPRPLGRDVPAFQASADPAAEAMPAQAATPDGALRLAQALALALMHNPELAAFSREVRAAEAVALQAGLWPNPEFEIEAEGFGGSEERRGYRGAETTLSFSQLIALGGKLSKQTRVASLGRDLGVWDYEAKRLDVFAGTTKAFVDVLAGQENLALLEEQQEFARKLLDAVAQRVKAGKVSPLEETRAKVALCGVRIEVERAKRDLAAARNRLAATWGSAEATFTQVEGQFRTVFEPPHLEELLGKTGANPELARWETEIDLRRAALLLERSQRIPDLSLQLGGRRFEETDDHAAIAGVSIPLPITDRNQGGIRAAQHRLARALDERRAAEVRVKTDLSDTYQSLSSFYIEVVSLKEELLPGAEHAARAVQVGYEEGKFAYIDVADAQRTLFEARTSYVQALAGYHKSRADTERLTGDLLELPDKEMKGARQ